MVKAICDHAALFEKGRLIESDPLANLPVDSYSRLRSALLPDRAAEQAFLRRHEVEEITLCEVASPGKMWPLLLDGTLDTLYMVSLAALFTVCLLPAATASCPHRTLTKFLAVVNIGRPLPFIVLLIGFSSMAGVIGGGGLGDLAIRCGYQRVNRITDDGRHRYHPCSYGATGAKCGRPSCMQTGAPALSKPADGVIRLSFRIFSHPLP